ncbi:MAG: hypothetical protein K8T10_05715 [Candidatus Eremiobacteraeota bacterium]|nr:hypothetical protein [Candidatus Eremiobacteraeota bacterium]
MKDFGGKVNPFLPRFIQERERSYSAQDDNLDDSLARDPSLRKTSEICKSRS